MQKLLIDYITRMEAANGFEEKWACLTDTLASLGFNVVNYTVFANAKTHEDPVFIENFRNDWMKHYAAQKYGPEDALIPHVLKSDIPALMFAIDERQPLQWSEKGKQLISEAKDAGMERAIGFSHRNGNGLVDGGISIGTDMMSSRDFSDFLTDRVPLLYMIYSIAYHQLHSQCRQNLALDALKISSRQYDLLMALWDGLSNKQISERLGVSEVTVSFHLKQLRNKLGCRLNREIIPRAYHYGILATAPGLST